MSEKDNYQQLEQSIPHIWQIAKDFGLDPYPTEFLMVPADVMHQYASYGIPGHFSHWTYGRDYRNQKTNYDLGMGKIYELVINTNPSQAYLMENNNVTENKLVVAHVFGHTDFFAHNRLFEPVTKEMTIQSKLHAERIKSYEDEIGFLEVEKFIDAAMTLNRHIDPYAKHRQSRQELLRQWREKTNSPTPTKKMAYPDLFNDPVQEVKQPFRIPLEPDADLLGFIRDFAPNLEDWKADILEILRNEAHYFYPQMRTKMMNEGWAAFWHKRIMRELGNRDLLDHSETEIWATLHSSITRPHPKSINPYFLGMVMFDYLLDYFNGDLSDDENRWLKSVDLPIYPKYDGELATSPGLEQLLMIRETEDDAGFVRNNFNKNVSTRADMYLYQTKRNGFARIDVVVDNDWQTIRDKLADSYSHNNIPKLIVIDSDYRSSEQLLIRHDYQGVELDLDYLKKTLPHLYHLWGRGVNIETVVDNQLVIYSYKDGDFGYIKPS